MGTKNSSLYPKKIVNILFWLLLIISAVLLMVFIVTFWGPISNNLTVWYEYGSFLAFIVSLVNLACFISLTYNASIFQESSHRKQMLAQKIELQTEFRKAHIDDIRKKMMELNQLPTMRMNDDESFYEFTIRCKSLIRVFGIYENNNNQELFGKCNYTNINKYFSELNSRLDAILRKKSLPLYDDKVFFNEVLGNINNEMIILEKSLSDYTFQELVIAFNTESE